MCTMVGNLSTRQSTEVFKTRHNTQELCVCAFLSSVCMMCVCICVPMRLCGCPVSCFCWLAKRPGLETTAAGEKHALEFLQQPSDLLTGQRSIVRFKDCVTSGYVFIFGKPTLPRKQVGVPFSPCLSMQSLRLSK